MAERRDDKDSETPVLLPCPFCGGEAEERWPRTIIGNEAVQCKSCHALVPCKAERAEWNRRAAVSSTPPNGHCSLNVAQGTQCALAGHCIGNEPTIQSAAASARSSTRAITHPNGLWMVFYEDADMRPEVFFGEGAEQGARARYASAKDNWSCHLLSRVPESAVSAIEPMTEEQFMDALRALGEKMAADGKPVVKHLLGKADEGMEKCRFENWAEHLQEEAYQWIGVEAPVRVYPLRRSDDTTETKS